MDILLFVAMAVLGGLYFVFMRARGTLALIELSPFAPTRA